MTTCRFHTDYYNYESEENETFSCPEQPLESGLCIFHDENYLQDKTKYDERKRTVLERLEYNVNQCISDGRTILCIGFYLPDFSLSDKKFAKPVYFKSSQFLGQADFSRFTFLEKADFSEVVFKGETKFWEATFKGEANFLKSTFQEKAYFFEATFQEKANFSEVTFKGVADFSDVAFKGKAEFWNAKFHEIASFGGATFKGGAKFFVATFKGGAIFVGATFQEEAYFLGATFKGKAIFTSSTFKGEAKFSEATFQEKAYFCGATFQEKADFNETTFHEIIYFNIATFKGEAIFVTNEFLREAFFIHIIFEQPNKVFFNYNNLSKVSFADTDITRIRFGDKIAWGDKKDDFSIIEEEWLQQKSAGKKPSIDVSLELALSVFRNLRENYEFRLRYDAAGKLFIKEMELKRNFREVPTKEEKDALMIKKNNWVRRHFSLNGLYYHFSRYGESISRPEPSER